MIITRLKGGMGNQMFQYAFGLKIAQSLGTDLQLDLSALLDRSRGDFVYRNYDLSIFNVQDQFVFNPSIIKKLSLFKSSRITKMIRNQINKKRTFIKEEHFHFQAKIIKQAVDNTIYEGWFQSYCYFEGIEALLRKEFTFKSPVLASAQSLLSEIQSCNAICLNVRRTDFLKVDNLNTTNKTYFMEAAKRMSEEVENPVFFVFSDDIEWCRENIILDHPVNVVGHEHKGEKFGNYMQLMIACKHFIIPNSSFAWWAVWLNTNPSKTVIAPQNWFNNPDINTIDLIPSQWIRL